MDIAIAGLELPERTTNRLKSSMVHVTFPAVAIPAITTEEIVLDNIITFDEKIVKYNESPKVPSSYGSYQGESVDILDSAYFEDRGRLDDENEDLNDPRF